MSRVADGMGQQNVQMEWGRVGLDLGLSLGPWGIPGRNCFILIIGPWNVPGPNIRPNNKIVCAWESFGPARVGP